MSTRRHCDICDDQITGLDNFVTIKVGGMAGAIASILSPGDIEMCAACWTSMIQHVKTTRQEANQ